MATNQIDALRWLARRVEWENTMVDLHLRAPLDVHNEAPAVPLVAPSVATAGTGEGEQPPETAERTTGSWSKRQLRRRRSPVRL